MYDFTVCQPILLYIFQVFSGSPIILQYTSNCCRRVGIENPIEFLMSLMNVHICGFEYTSHYQENYSKCKEMNKGFCRIWGAEKLKKFLFEITTAMLSWKLLICQNRILKEFGGMKLCTGERLTTLDIDWTTLLSYSEKKEGAQRGMNKKKKGKPCFQLSLSFIENLFVDSKLCPGLSNPKNLLQKKVERAMTLGYKFSAVRADSAYGSTENLRYLQSLSLYYAIGATHTYTVIKQARQTFKQQVRKKGAPGIIHISEGLQVYDFGMHNIAKDGEQPLNCRIITCRRIQRTKKKGKWKVKSYYYSILTNLDWSVKQVVKYYHLRNRIENGIKELKYHYHLERLPAEDLQANEFYIDSKILAMTMMKLFAINNLPKSLHSMWRKTLLRKIFGRHLLALQGEEENILIVEIRLKCPYSWHFKRILKKLLLDRIRQNSRSAVA